MANNVGVLWEQQARHGYRNGVALAHHSVGGRHFFLDVDRDQTFKKDPTVDNVFAELSVFTSLAQETALRLFAPDIDILAPIDPLSQAEIELLRRSMDGNSVIEITQIMKVSEGSASSLFQSAMLKLRSSTKYEAIMKAIRPRLLR